MINYNFWFGWQVWHVLDYSVYHYYICGVREEI